MLETGVFRPPLIVVVIAKVSLTIMTDTYLLSELLITHAPVAKLKYAIQLHTVLGFCLIQFIVTL